MVKFGIFTGEQFLALGEERWRSVPRVAYKLLNVGDHPTEDQIRIFENISFALRTSNGTTRTTFQNRFRDIEPVFLRWMKTLFQADAPVRVQDCAVSHGLTTAEWTETLRPTFPHLEMEASDLVLDLVHLILDNNRGEYIAEMSGVPLQYIKAPFVLPLSHRESRRYPINRWMGDRALRRFQALHLPADWAKTTGGPGYQVRRIPYIHPRARRLMKEGSWFRFVTRSVFDATPDAACHVVRTMNILNFQYFPVEQLTQAVSSVFSSLQPGGMWIVGRTLEEDFSNHVSILRRGQSGWEILERIGQGSEMEELALRASAPVP